MTALKISLDGESYEFKRSEYAQALNAALSTRQAGLEHYDYKFFVKDKEVSFDEFIQACADVAGEKQAAKELTHKQIWVHNGASNAANTWSKKWVRK